MGRVEAITIEYYGSDEERRKYMSDVSSEGGGMTMNAFYFASE